LPPGDPGGGITGVVARPLGGGLTVNPGSTFGGLIVPFCCDNRLLKFPLGGLPSEGAILSGGGEGAFGGAMGTVGLAGDVGCGFCASAGVATRSKAVNESVRSMVLVPSSFEDVPLLPFEGVYLLLVNAARRSCEPVRFRLGPTVMAQQVSTI
jgi:hypothetical protein